MRLMLSSKLHRAVVTEADLQYEGSVTIDADLMAQVNMVAYEKVDIYNITNGHRFSTYAIEGEAGSGTVCINGAAAHLAGVGDRVIICSYRPVREHEARGHRPKILVLDEANRPIQPVGV